MEKKWMPYPASARDHVSQIVCCDSTALLSDHPQSLARLLTLSLTTSCQSACHLVLGSAVVQEIEMISTILSKIGFCRVRKAAKSKTAGHFARNKNQI